MSIIAPYNIGISINDQSSGESVQALGAVSGLATSANQTFNNNSAYNYIGLDVYNVQNAGSGSNTGILVNNQSTEWTTATLVGSGIGIIQN